MFKRFDFDREDWPGGDWLTRFIAGRPKAERWDLRERRPVVATAGQCRDALRHQMPELLQPYDRVSALVGADQVAGIGFTIWPFIGAIAWARPAMGHGCASACSRDAGYREPRNT